MPAELPRTSALFMLSNPLPDAAIVDRLIEITQCASQPQGFW